MSRCKMYFKIFVYAFYIINYSMLTTVFAKQQTVNTTHGLISGKQFKTLLKQVEYYGFMGIPYATPPLNELRFLPPKDVSSWDNILATTKEKPPCMQFNKDVKSGNMGQFGSEDCLYLDIFTPDVDKNNRAVIVLLFNEQFRYSNNKTKDYGPDFFIEEDVIVATISHRLSVFGFLSLEDDNLWGNSGLKDVVLGLEWIKNNIERFGGDSNRITLMGHGAGAAAVDLLIHSKSKNLINAAIMQSGTSLSSQYLQENIRERAFKLGDLLETSSTNSRILLKDLSTISADQLLNKELNSLPPDYYKENQKPLLAFGPIVERDPKGLITEYPENALISIDIPVMIGSNSREGLEMSLLYLVDPRFIVYLKKDFHFLLPLRSKFKFDPLKDYELYSEAIEEIKNYYFKHGVIKHTSYPEYITYIGDVLKTYPIDAMTRMYANKSNSPVYYYHFDYYSELNDNKNKILKLSTVTDGTWGAASGDELCYLFKCPRLKSHYIKFDQSQSEEIVIQRKLVRLWSNFAKYGNPTLEDNNPLENLTWPKYNLETKEYLHISNQIEVKQNLLQKRFNFWDTFLNKWEQLLKQNIENKTNNKEEL